MSLCILVCFCGGLAPAVASEPVIDAAFPGGNIRVVSREQNTFVLAPDLRDTRPGEWWFYYNFRLRTPSAQPVTVIFVEKNPTGVRGPAISVDEGRTWEWLGKESVTAFQTNGKPAWRFTASVPKGASDARFAFAPQYLQSHLQEWLNANQNNPALQVSELCRSRKGRPVELIRAGQLDGPRRAVVLVTARHHACESVASYTLEGLLSAVLANDELGLRCRQQLQVIALPFMDKDGVEDGDQGKNRAPHDHNRDYNSAPLYPEIAAWMKLGESIKQDVVFSLDLHCPYIRGQWNDRVYIVGSASPEFARRERAFAATLGRLREGPLPFNAAGCYLPSGVAWNTAGNYAAGRSSGEWARHTFPNAAFAATMEIAYAEALGVEVTADAARALGRDLARAIISHVEHHRGLASPNSGDAR